jgi:TPP-dependent pyruvate/acetoin dehydrogenase alpha subunit
VRSPDAGTTDYYKHIDSETSLEMFRRASLCRNFELYLRELMEKRDMGMPIYLSHGQEYMASALSISFPDCSIFAQHRGHSIYLAYGGDIHKLVDELLMRETGCCSGMGGSACIQDQDIQMFGHSGLLGDQVPIAVGAALGGHKRVLSIAGDAAAEEDYVLGAIGFAATRKLPVLFVCEDNDLSILTHINIRRSWSIVDVASGFGVEGINIADDPWTIMQTVNSIEALPHYLNIYVCRKLWHAGYGTDGPPEWDRHDLVMKNMDEIGLYDKAQKIDTEMKEYVTSVWEGHLG